MLKDYLIPTKKSRRRNNVTTMTSSGHVTSSETWPLDSPWALFYLSWKQPAISLSFRDITPQRCGQRHTYTHSYIQTSTWTDNMPNECLKLAARICQYANGPMCIGFVIVTSMSRRYLRHSESNLRIFNDCSLPFPPLPSSTPQTLSKLTKSFVILNTKFYTN